MIQYVLAATLLSSPAAHTTEVACRSAPTRLVPTASRGDASGVKLLDVPPGSYWGGSA